MHNSWSFDDSTAGHDSFPKAVFLPEVTPALLPLGMVEPRWARIPVSSLILAMSKVTVFPFPETPISQVGEVTSGSTSASPLIQPPSSSFLPARFTEDLSAPAVKATLDEPRLPNLYQPGPNRVHVQGALGQRPPYAGDDGCSYLSLGQTLQGAKVVVFLVAPGMKGIPGDMVEGTPALRLSAASCFSDCSPVTLVHSTLQHFVEPDGSGNLSRSAFEVAVEYTSCPSSAPTPSLNVALTSATEPRRTKRSSTSGSDGEPALAVPAPLPSSLPEQPMETDQPVKKTQQELWSLRTGLPKEQYLTRRQRKKAKQAAEATTAPPSKLADAPLTSPPDPSGAAAASDSDSESAKCDSESGSDTGPEVG